MQANINIVETSVNLGQPVTVNYSSTGFDNTQIMADCLINPNNLGSGDQSGTIKFLPVVNGTFNVSILCGVGDQTSDGVYYKSNIMTASIPVN
jgi:hypothetical protein